MGVVQEWHWLCEVDGCPDHSEEPQGSEEAARMEFGAHMDEVHPEQKGATDAE